MSTPVRPARISIGRLTGALLCAVVLTACTAAGTGGVATVKAATASTPADGISGTTTIPAGAPEPSTGSGTPIPAAHLQTGPGSAAVLLATAGVATQADEVTPGPLVPLTGPASAVRVTAWQADQMDVEIHNQAGVLGSDLDAAVPMPKGALPISYLIAGWLVAGSSPAAVAARTLMGKQDWVHAGKVVFPTVALTMFVADTVRHADGGDPSASPSSQTPAPGSPGPPGLRRAAGAPLTETPCTTIANFANDVLSAVFGRLSLNVQDVTEWADNTFGDGHGDSTAGTFAFFLATAWNVGVSLARQALETGIGAITKPIVAAIRLAIGALATITTLVSYLKKWSAPVVAQPNPDQFAIGPEPDHTGRFTVQINRNAEIDDWPKVLVDCAGAVDVTLPTLTKAGLPVHWRVLAASAPVVNFAAPGLPATTPLDTALTTSVRYVTGREDARTAKGEPVRDTIKVGVSVRRTEVAQLKDFILAFLTREIPGIARPIVTPLIKPYLERLFTFIDGITGVDGNETLTVAHHLPPVCKPGPAIPVGEWTPTPGLALGSFALVESRPGQGRIAERARLAALAMRSDGTRVTGSMALSWNGAGMLRFPGAISFSVQENSTLRGAISGPVANPVVDGVITGTETVDGQATAGSRRVHLHLHVTATCAGARGDVLAMLRETVHAPVALQGGPVVWTALWDPL